MRIKVPGQMEEQEGTQRNTNGNKKTYKNNSSGKKDDEKNQHQHIKAVTSHRHRYVCVYRSVLAASVWHLHGHSCVDLSDDARNTPN